MRFNVLGPIEVMYDGQVRTPTAMKVRWIMALLLLRDNQIVDAGALVDELWGDTPPRSAVATMQSYVYQLRKTFRTMLHADGVDALLLTRPPGYGLRVAQDQVDVRVFESLADQGRALLAAGRPREASQRLTEALELWRGPALADLRPGRLLEAHVARLEETRIRTLELRITADIELGLHREVIPELRSLVIAHPLNEWFHGTLIEALKGAGRRSEALRAYQDLRRVLDEELGLEPSIRLRRLQNELLTGGAHDGMGAPELSMAGGRMPVLN